VGFVGRVDLAVFEIDKLLNASVSSWISVVIRSDVGSVGFGGVEIDKLPKWLVRTSMSRSKVNVARSVGFGSVDVDTAKLLDALVGSWISIVMVFDIGSVDFVGVEIVQPWNSLVRFSMSMSMLVVFMVELEDDEMDKPLKRSVRSWVPKSMVLSLEVTSDGIEIIKPWNNLVRFSISGSISKVFNGTMGSKGVEIDRPSKRIVRYWISKSMVLLVEVTMSGPEIDRCLKRLARSSNSNAMTVLEGVEIVNFLNRAVRSSKSMVLSVTVDSGEAGIVKSSERLVGVWMPTVAIVERIAMIAYSSQEIPLLMVFERLLSDLGRNRNREVCVKRE